MPQGPPFAGAITTAVFHWVSFSAGDFQASEGLRLARRILDSPRENSAGEWFGCGARGLLPRTLEVERQDSLFAYGAEGAERILDLRKSVTAVVAGDDEIALGVLTTLNRHGVDVPGESLSIAGTTGFGARGILPTRNSTLAMPKQNRMRPIL